MADREIEHVEAIAVTSNALEQMEHANIDIQIATALAHPRSMAKFYERAIAMVTFDADTAASCIYRRPVGKENGVMKYAEGESIRLAEMVAASYGNIRISGMIIEMDARYVKAIGIAHDLENNYAVKAEVVESTVTKEGVPFSERMRVVVAKSAQSKAIRDATFRVIPKSLCKPLVLKAKEVAKGDAKTFDSRRKAVVEWIKTLKIDIPRVWDAIGIQGEADISVEVLLLLNGLKTALEEGDCTIDEAFPKPVTEQTGTTADRIKDKFKDKDEKPPEKPKTKVKVKKEPELAPAPPPEPEKEPEPDPEHEPEQEPTTVGKDKYKCQRCDRQFPELKNGKCPFCFSDKYTEL
ncbi:MAG: hypothetical protein MUO78_06580 [candidate division Zixibacteria bacterium]|nr:hypothetical protein [candidate division Zixibacteria bacterium]